MPVLILSDEVIQKAVSLLASKPAEDNIPYMYRDSKVGKDNDHSGLVTIGIGQQLATEEDAVKLLFGKLEWHNRHGEKEGGIVQKVEEQDIRHEWRAVKGMPMFHEIEKSGKTNRVPQPASHYLKARKTDRHLALQAGAAERLATEHLKRKVLPPLHTHFPDFIYLPHDAQIALIDMMYNLGKEGFKKYRQLIDAVRTRDWIRAGFECWRHGIHDSRNSSTAMRFAWGASVQSRFSNRSHGFHLIEQGVWPKLSVDSASSTWITARPPNTGAHSRHPHHPHLTGPTIKPRRVP